MSLADLGLPRSLLSSTPASILFPVAVGSGIGFFLNKGADTKDTYTKRITQPPGAPPPWVFGPMWTCLYASMGYAAHQAYLARPTDSWGQGLFTAQLILNFAWTPLFFRWGKVGVALADMLAMEAAIVTLANRWWGVGGEFLVPYAIWTAYATYITVGVGSINGWDIGRRIASKKY